MLDQLGNVFVGTNNFSLTRNWKEKWFYAEFWSQHYAIHTCKYLFMYVDFSKNNNLVKISNALGSKIEISILTILPACFGFVALCTWSNMFDKCHVFTTSTVTATIRSAMGM